MNLPPRKVACRPAPPARVSRLAVALLAMAAAQLAPALAAGDEPPLDAAAAPASATTPGRWLFVLPFLAYSPETRLIFGASGAYERRYGDEGDARPSTLLPVVQFTAKRQLLLSLAADVWTGGDAWHLTTVLGYRRFPTVFYGVGDDTPAAREEPFTDLTGELGIELMRRLAGPVYVGGILSLGSTRVRDLEDGGLLATAPVNGARGGEQRGVGVKIAWDGRDAVQYPTRGGHHRVAVTRFVDMFGGDHVFTAVVTDLAQYVPLGGARVLAFNLHAALQSGGDVPFYLLNRLGLRGYFEERHRERNVVRGQVELRTGLWRRFGAAFFAGAGELAATRGSLRLDEARPMLGAGLRYDVGRDQRANLAVDVGFGDGDSGVYVRFAEAF